MANQEQLERLLQSVSEQNGCEAWNQWREEHADVPLDLSGATIEHAQLSFRDLMSADLTNTRSIIADHIADRLKKIDYSTASIIETHLRGVDLNGARLRNADLRRTHLEAAHLSGADLEAADLSGADLMRADLARARLRNADLSDANLAGAHLVAAHLEDANLSHANLAGAHLMGIHLDAANLSGTRFIRADLSGGSLSDTRLNGADFTGADLNGVRLSGADLSGAILFSTRFRHVDLRGVKGLDAVHHRGPSSIATDVLYASQGDIPDLFLRGCGLPDDLIAFTHSLAGAVQYPHVFISYSEQDEALATRLFTDLQANNVRCWRLTDHRKRGGAPRIQNEVISAVRLQDKFLIILSEHSVKSDWINDEVSRAMGGEDAGEHIVYPIAVDDAVKQIQWGWARDITRSRKLADFRDWQDPEQYQPMFERLLRGLQQRVYL